MQSVFNVPTTDDHIVTQHARSNSEKTERFGGAAASGVTGSGVANPEVADMKTSQGSGSKAFYHPHPLPMPEFGGWFAPLTECLPDASQPISTFHRCNLAAILLTDLVVDGLDLDCHSVDWSVHIPLMLHIIFLGLDNSREMVYKHCRQLLLNLLIVLGRHNDHLGISRVMMTTKIDLMNFGLSLPSLPVIKHTFTEKKVTDPKDTSILEDDDSNQRDSASSISEDDETERGN